MSLRWRLTLFNALGIGAILALMSLALVLLLSEVLLDGVEKTTRSRALSAARVVEAGEPLSPEYEELLGFDGTFVVVRDGEGGVLHATAGAPARETPPSAPWDSAPWERALGSEGPASGEVGRPSGHPDFVYAVPVDPPEGGPADGPAYPQARVVEAGKSYGAATNIESVDGVLSAVILAAFALSLAGAYLLARAALAPVGAVVDSAREITEGDLSKRLPVARPKDEIGRLAATVNDLLSRLEAAFARREEALARQRRFAADAGHELRTPLTSVVGYADMLEEWGLEDPETAREGVAAIRREAERVQGLVEDLLALARGDEGAPSTRGPTTLGPSPRRPRRRRGPPPGARSPSSTSRPPAGSRPSSTGAAWARRQPSSWTTPRSTPRGGAGSPRRCGRGTDESSWRSPTRASGSRRSGSPSSSSGSTGSTRPARGGALPPAARAWASR